MATERLFADIIQDFLDAKTSGALYVSVVEISEDLIRMYFKDGQIYHIRYGTAIGNDVLEVLEYYNLYGTTFFEGITAPDKHATDLPPTNEIMNKIREINKTIKEK